MKVVLGSSSPRRKDILSLFFKKFEIRVPEVEEIFHPGEKPMEFACRISEKKMDFIISNIDLVPPYLVITSDTIVTIDDKILGKPGEYTGAVEMIESLSGRTHEVISSVCICINNEENKLIKATDKESTRVTFKKLSMEDIDNYLNSIKYMDKAGAYAIQENGEMIVEQYDGSLSNVIGFPVRLFLKMLNQNGLIHII